MINGLLERNPRIANWLYGFTPPERGTVELVHRRVYIVPARLGWYSGATLLVLLVGSINYALSLGFALTFLLAGLGLAGMVHTARNLARTSRVQVNERTQDAAHLIGGELGHGWQIHVFLERRVRRELARLLGDATRVIAHALEFVRDVVEREQEARHLSARCAPSRAGRGRRGHRRRRR